MVSLVIRSRKGTKHEEVSSTTTTTTATPKEKPSLPVSKLMKKKRKGKSMWDLPFVTFMIIIGFITSINVYRVGVKNDLDYNNTSINIIGGHIKKTKIDISNAVNRSSIGTTNNNETKKVVKPKFIIHVGPPKTGSTSIQCTLESLRQELIQDEIIYIGRPECHSQKDTRVDIDHQTKKIFRLFEKALVIGFDCHKQLIQYERNNTSIEDLISLSLSLPCWGQFVQQLQAYKEKGNNIIFSDEAMSNRIARVKRYRPNVPYPFYSLKTILEHLGWDVRILIIHRPLYDYLPSVYVEQYKIGPSKVLLSRWFGDDTTIGTNSTTSSICPSQNGRVIPKPFDSKPQTKEITIANLLEENQKLYSTPAQVVEIFLEKRFNIIVVDMMEKFTSNKNGKEFDFIQYIICEIFPNTLNTCNALLLHNEGTESSSSSITSAAGAAEKVEMSKSEIIQKLNPSLSLHYDSIAVEACRKGIINGSQISREVARSTIQRYHEIDLGLKPNDLPLDCPNDDQYNHILNASLDHQKRICNQLQLLELDVDGIESKCSQKAKNMTHHQDQFWKSVNEKKKFCSVNVSLVLNDVKWIEFLSESKNFFV